MDSDNDGESFVERNLSLMKERLARRLEKKRRKLEQEEDLEPLLDAQHDDHLQGELVDDPPGDPHGGLLGDPLDGAPVQGDPLLDPDATDVETLAERVKKAVLKGRPRSVLTHISKMSNFPGQFNDFLFKHIRKEVEAGCQQLSEPEPAAFSRGDIEQYEQGAYYNTLCEHFPSYMTTLVAATTSTGTRDVNMQLPTASSKHGPRGSVVDLRGMLNSTASRPLHTHFPRKLNVMAKLTSLHHGVNSVPGREVRKANTLGDSYSKKESLRLMERACDGHDEPIMKMKQDMESVYLSGAATTKRAKEAMVKRLNVRGFGVYGDNVDLSQTSRYNNTCQNKNRVHHRTMMLCIENRVPSAMKSDLPVISPMDVNFELGEDQQGWIRAWMDIVVKKMLTTHCKHFESCKQYIKVPSFPFAEKMAEKSKCHVLSVSNDDPATNQGATNVCLRLLNYLPVTTHGGEVRKKICLHGDQGFCERFRKAICSRTDETVSQRLSPLVALPQDWHAKLQSLRIWRQVCDRPGQQHELGSISRTKTVFKHTQADIKVKHFYANESLLKATTTMNIIGLAQELGGKDFINSTEDGGLTEAAFNSFVDSLVDEIDMLPWIWNKAPDSPTSDDRFLQFRKDTTYLGVHFLARSLCIQYGDGRANDAFWLSDMYWYNALGKHKYRIEAFEKLCAAQGVHGEAVALDSTYNRFCNDKGGRNTNKPGDLKVEHVNGDYKARVETLKGNITEHRLSLTERTIDLGPKLDAKLNVRYVGGVDEKEKGRKKRQEAFATQVRVGVNEMHAERVLRYTPGRGLQIKAPKHLREERDNGVPKSFSKLSVFLRVRKRAMVDFVNETCEWRFEGGRPAADKDNAAANLEIGPEMELAESEDEDYSDVEEYDSE